MEILTINGEEISTVKEYGNNHYIVNGKITVSKSGDNPDYKVLLVWLETNTADPEFSDIELNEKMKGHFKTLYLNITSQKLKELDYDSLATVKLWEGDDSFGAEATQILTWYKNIILLNYQILNDVTNNARPIPTDDEYKAEINSIVF